MCVAGAVASVLAVAAAASAAEGPAYLREMGASATRRAAIAVVRTEAAVTVSDGLTYVARTVMHDGQRAIFHREYADRVAATGVEGQRVWSYDGTTQSEAPPFVGDVVLGHQFHAHLLFFDELNAPVEEETAACHGPGCAVRRGATGRSLHVAAESRRPVALTIARDEMPDVRVSFDDWRPVDGIDLPFLADIDDGERSFRYAFRTIDLAAGSLDELRAPMDALTDEQQLFRLHRDSMDAHFLGDPARKEGVFGDEVVFVNAGEVHSMSGADAEAVMTRILTSRVHDRYDDLAVPRITVSADGTLGWVVARVGASGRRLDADGKPGDRFSFTCAWISMFEKRAGEWKMVGNVANFVPTE